MRNYGQDSGFLYYGFVHCVSRNRDVFSLRFAGGAVGFKDVGAT